MIYQTAIRFRGKIWTLPRPARHNHVMSEILKHYENDKSVYIRQDMQGFITDAGEFVDRNVAGVIAYHCKQIDRIKKLFSEDVW